MNRCLLTIISASLVVQAGCVCAVAGADAGFSLVYIVAISLLVAIVFVLFAVLIWKCFCSKRATAVTSAAPKVRRLTTKQLRDLQHSVDALAKEYEGKSDEDELDLTKMNKMLIALVISAE